MTQVPLDDLLPHRPPMVLIDGVESFNAAAMRLVARVTIREGQLFYAEGGVPNWVAIEYMAQAAAALVGVHDKHLAPDRPVRPGLMLGTRRLDLRLRISTRRQPACYRLAGNPVQRRRAVHPPCADERQQWGNVEGAERQPRLLPLPRAL